MKSALDTPMMRQYLEIKKKVPDALLFYRMGDFYELFLDDAVVAAPILDIALTTRDKNKADAVPMCGVPVHGVDPYIKRLAEQGFRVAVCEQVEDAKAAAGRRLVKRDVVEVVTPGLVGDPTGLEAKNEIHIAAFFADDDRAGLAFLESSTGELRCVECEAAAGVLPPTVIDELSRVAPRELLIPERFAAVVARYAERDAVDLVWSVVPDRDFDPGTIIDPPLELESEGQRPGDAAAAALLRFVAKCQPALRALVERVGHYAISDTMVIDASTRRHLEIFQNNEDGGRSGTLFERLDESVTALGARRLKRWLAYPLLRPDLIRQRQDAVALLCEGDLARDALRDALRAVRDLERLLAVAGRPSASPRDLRALRESLDALPRVALACARFCEDRVAPRTALPFEVPVPVPEAAELLAEALVDDPPVLARGSRGALESGYIRRGFRPELDVLHESAEKGREWIAGLEREERERSGLSALKVRFHPVHGYSLEVSKSQAGRVPDDYERKQTLANVERYTTPALREMENKVLGARERAAAMEREIFGALREEILRSRPAIAAAARAVGVLDALAALAEVARRDAWVRPAVDEGEALRIDAGRHPVVESLLRARDDDPFVPNDCDLHPDETQILLITGPNMSGKSTYLRQVALCALLAQIGSFVPAASAQIGVVDRIFTRVGASDRLARGESTFMVEMRESAEILAQATRRSLVILDEIGRGTSTFDGLSIAWAVAEYFHTSPRLGCRTLFATHYHELIELAETLPRLSNAHFAAREWGEDIVFLRRLEQGGANRSYGIQVARLAGLPDAVIERAKNKLRELEAQANAGSATPQLRLFDRQRRDSERQDSRRSAASAAERDVLAAIRASDPDTTAPLDALLAIARWRAALEDETP